MKREFPEEDKELQKENKNKKKCLNLDNNNIKRRSHELKDIHNQSTYRQKYSR